MIDPVITALVNKDPNCPSESSLENLFCALYAVAAVMLEKQ